MDAIAQLGSILGLSFISGINLYATVAVTGLCARYGLIQGLPPELQVFANDAVIFVALALYAVEFFMDKIQGLDTLWDTLHTVIRPLGGALVALMQLGEASPALEVIVFLLGASLASSAHALKAGTRLLINASPEPFSNIVVSFAEDVGAVGYTVLTLAYPRAAFFLTLALLVVVFLLLPLIFRTIRMLAGAIWFRIKAFFMSGTAATDLRILPLSLASFLDAHRSPEEETVWAGRAYAAKIASVSRATPLYVIVTDRTIYCLYRKRFRPRLKQIPRSDIQRSEIHPGRLFARWILKSRDQTWFLMLYPSLSATIPKGLEGGSPGRKSD
jgi:hypothetical protein